MCIFVSLCVSVYVCADVRVYGRVVCMPVCV